MSPESYEIIYGLEKRMKLLKIKTIYFSLNLQVLIAK